MKLQVLFKNKDNDQQIVEGVVYSPNVVDAHNDFVDSDNVMKLYNLAEAHKDKDGLIDTNHDRVPNGSKFLSHFINGIHKNDERYPLGAWVMAVKVQDKNVWEKVKSGELNAYSMDFTAFVEEVEAQVVVHKDNFGYTSEAEDHKHVWYLELDENGRVKSGRTDEVNGHYHKIKSAVVTEPAMMGDSEVEHKHKVRQCVE